MHGMAQAGAGVTPGHRPRYQWWSNMFHPHAASLGPGDPWLTVGICIMDQLSEETASQM